MQNVVGWEKTLLGTVIYDHTQMEDAIDLLPPDFTGSHILIWGVVMELYQTGNLGMRTLVETLKEKQLLDSIVSPEGTDITGEAYIVELINNRGEDLGHYVQKVIDASGTKSLQQTAGVISSLAQDDNIGFQEALDQAEELVLSLRRDRSSERGVLLRDLLTSYMDRLEKMRRGELVPGYVPSIVNLKEIIQYAEEDEYIVIAARPGDGKSSLLRHEAWKMALEGKNVLIFNLENSHIEYARAMLSLHTGINNELLKSPQRLSDEQMMEVKRGHHELNELGIHIVSLGGPSIEEIRRIARAKIAKYNIDMIMVDYIQLMFNGNKTNANDDITRSSSGLRAMSLNWGIPIMAAAQLNRDIERRGADAEPMLADLRSSGSLEQDATQVWFLRKLWGEPTENQLLSFSANQDQNGNLLPKIPALPMRIFVKKNRNGPVGTTEPILWNRSTGIIDSLATRVVDLNAGD